MLLSDAADFPQFIFVDEFYLPAVYGNQLLGSEDGECAYGIRCGHVG